MEIVSGFELTGETLFPDKSEFSGFIGQPVIFQS